ncbi:MAG: hypothetical protein ACSNEK_03225 [Parachlamydiaceae bacterium]
MNLSEYLTYNEIGLVPGPGEEELAFNQRVRYCLGLKKECIAQFLEGGKPFVHQPISNEVLQSTQYYYGIQPSWVSIVYSDEQLALWHGGSAWIFQIEESAPTAAFLQLRSVFAHKNDYLCLLHKSELMTHELSHVGRMMFTEPKFEEMLAYQSSPSWLARNLGPLVQSSIESVVFVIVLMILILLDITTLFLNQPSLYLLAVWFKLVPVVMLGSAVLRLVLKKIAFKRCYQKVRMLCQSRQKTRAILYRLTDAEIIYFAKASLPAIQAYIHSKNELRWQVIKKAYHL